MSLGQGMALEPQLMSANTIKSSAVSESPSRAVTVRPTNRERFLDACHCRRLDYPPVWLMRQAGRALPEYRALKQKWSFLELVQTPEMAAEVTLQPIRRFDFDAAILFSDILVVPEGLGQRYRFHDVGGIEMEFTLQSAADVDRLEVQALPGRLKYMADALQLVRAELATRTALIGFAGSPWTLANFMLEGGGVDRYSRAEALFNSDRALFNRLMEKLTQAVASCLKLQIAAGVDAVQIFDSLGGLLPGSDFAAASARWIKDVIALLDSPTPVIVFSRGIRGNWDDVTATGARVVGVDWTVNLADIAGRLPASVAVQGNLDPAILITDPAIVQRETRRTIDGLADRLGHIFNLGHGVPPDAKIENIEALVRAVRSPKNRPASI
jgi:uroporphyrinogen decarboxylase